MNDLLSFFVLSRGENNSFLVLTRLVEGKLAEYVNFIKSGFPQQRRNFFLSPRPLQMPFLETAVGMSVFYEKRQEHVRQPPALDIPVLPRVKNVLFRVDERV